MEQIDLISNELARADELKDDAAQVIGMMRVKSALETIKEASERPNPQPLWLSLWYESEACCLFADSNLGKSILAVQIAESLARSGKKVLYFDFELSDKQFQIRYTDEMGNLYQFSPNLFRVEIDALSMYAENFEEALLDNIEQCADEIGADTIIIDNISWLCTAAEKGDLAGALMMRLTQIKRRTGLSILVIAHTPKRNLSNPITQNDLAGSKKLMNFFDSSFAIGKSAKDSTLRYIKQIKCRNGGFEYDAENVIVCQIKKTDAFLQFETIDHATEAEHLKQQSELAIQERIEKVKELSKKGLSQRQIASQLGISPASVNNYLKRAGKVDEAAREDEAAKEDEG